MLGEFTIQIEIVGTCNLRCPSCPVGNYGEMRKLGSVGGTMPVDYFVKVIDKCKEEILPDHEDSFISLYSWGEPLIHPNVGELITYARESGFRTGLSSNLNYIRNLESAIAAGVDEFVVSLSGFTQEVYARTHAGGDIEKVKINMRMLSELIAKYDYHTKVFVNYISYKSNVNVDMGNMLNYCDSLRFQTSPSIAYYLPVENMLRIAKGTADDRIDWSVVEKLLVPVDRQLEISAANAAPDEECDLIETRIDVDVDGAVKLCCASYERSHNIAKDFLSIPLDEIQASRRNAALCGDCMKFGINRIYTLKDYETWRVHANSFCEEEGRGVRFTDSGIDIHEAETEEILLSRFIRSVNKGEMEEAIETRERLYNLLRVKYVLPMEDFLSAMIVRCYGGAVRGQTIPYDPLRILFLSAVIMYNHERNPREANELLQEALTALPTLARDHGYAAIAVEMRPILEEWLALHTNVEKVPTGGPRNADR